MSDSKSWEERFDEKFDRRHFEYDGELEYDLCADVKQFISKLLHQTRQDTLEEVMNKMGEIDLFVVITKGGSVGGAVDVYRHKLKQQLTKMKGEV